MKKVLIIGSSNMDYTLYVDRFPLPGETLSGNSKFVQPGGKGANQAAAVAKTGLVEAHFVTCLGKDTDGTNIKEVLSNLGLNLHVKETDICTGNATIMVDSSSENEIIIVPGANGEITISDIDLNLLKEADFIILQNEIPMEVNEYIIDKSSEMGIKVIYNPAPYKPIKKECLAKLDTLIVNEVELEQSSGYKGIDEGAKFLLDLGVQNVLVTLGKNGSICYSKNNMIRVNAEKVKAVDTVAAGDTYVGYFTSVLATTGDIQKAMEIATKASAITVSRKGSIISIPFYKEIN